MLTPSKHESFWNKINSLSKRIKENLIGRLIQKSLWLYYAVLDSKIPAGVKAIILIALIYFVSPFDAIPDFIPVLGLADDLAIVSITVNIFLGYPKPKSRIEMKTNKKMKELSR